MNTIASSLSEWTAMWAAALPGFAIDSTWRVASARWTPLLTRPFEPLELESEDDVTLAILSLRSPGGRYTLDVDSYQYIRPEGDSLEVGGEPDSQCSLIDNRSHLEVVLQQCGTPGGFHWGMWLSRTSFAVGGWRDADDFGQWKQGRLWIYSIPESTLVEYETRIMSADDYARYQAAWHGWLLKRYRALKPMSPRT